MFEEIMGIPAHPLIVHAAVVLVPLQILAGLAYAFVPFVRKYIAWFVVGIAVAAPIAAFVAKLSGEAFRERRIRLGQANDELIASIDEHASFATRALWASLVLAVLMLAMVAMHARARRVGGDSPAGATSGSGAKVLTIAFAIAMLAASGVTGYYIFKAGDTGAKMVWTGF